MQHPIQYVASVMAGGVASLGAIETLGPSVLRDAPVIYSTIAIGLTIVGAGPAIIEKIRRKTMTWDAATIELLYAGPIGIVVYSLLAAADWQPVWLGAVAPLAGYIGRETLELLAGVLRSRVNNAKRGDDSDA